MAYGLLESRPMISERRVQVNGCAMHSPHSGCRAIREEVAGNNDQARRRWIWELVRARCREGESIRTEAGILRTTPPPTSFALMYLERISWLMLVHSWTRIGIILVVGNKVNLRRINPRRNDRTIPLRRPLRKDRSSTLRVSVNKGIGNLQRDAKLENRKRISRLTSRMPGNTPPWGGSRTK